MKILFNERKDGCMHVTGVKCPDPRSNAGARRGASSWSKSAAQVDWPLQRRCACGDRLKDRAGVEPVTRLVRPPSQGREHLALHLLDGKACPSERKRPCRSWCNQSLRCWGCCWELLRFLRPQRRPPPQLHERRGTGCALEPRGCA